MVMLYNGSVNTIVARRRAYLADAVHRLYRLDNLNLEAARAHVPCALNGMIPPRHEPFSGTAVKTLNKKRRPVIAATAGAFVLVTAKAS